MRTSLLFAAIAIASAALVSGCAMSVPGPAGDAGITYSSNGAEVDLNATPDKVAQASTNVLSGMGIHPIGTTATDNGHVVTGKGRVDQVKILIERSGSGSKVEVIDYSGNNNWSQDFAATILLQIKSAV